MLALTAGRALLNCVAAGGPQLRRRRIKQHALQLCLVTVSLHRGAAVPSVFRRLKVMAGQKETPEQRAERKAAQKAAKAAKRLQRQGLGDPSIGQKACTMCERPRDLLVRCQIDESRRWHMLCGRCWMQSSGGKVDGSSQHPHYRYGGLWKNHHKGVSGKSKVPKSASGVSRGGEAAAGTDSLRLHRDSTGPGSDDPGARGSDQQLLMAEVRQMAQEEAAGGDAGCAESCEQESNDDGGVEECLNQSPVNA